MYKTDFQDGHHGGLLGFLIKSILASFDQQVTLILSSKFQVSLPFGSGQEVLNSFSRQQPWQPSWISNQNDLC